MKYRDLREFITVLKQANQLKSIDIPISPHLEITEIADRVLRQQGPALLFTQPVDQSNKIYHLSLIHI